MHTNCDCGGKRQGLMTQGHTCGCDKFGGNTLRANLAQTAAWHVQYEGRDTLVVPVIMARADVVMNGSLVPFEEFYPEAWNGVPVTVGHPETAEGNTTANDPHIMTEWAVGRIYNSRVEDGALKAEAWIDVQRAENLSPGLVADLEAGNPMDVSTGYFSKDVAQRGQTNNGQHYSQISRELNPDHLALLPDAVGACSWEDGCGVRVNKEKNRMSKIKLPDPVQKAIDGLVAALGGAEPSPGTVDPNKPGVVHANARGDDDDYRQIVADLISDNRSPFLPNDLDSLNMMSGPTIMLMRDHFLPKKGSKKENSQMADLTDDEKKAINTNAAAAALQSLKDAGLPTTKEELASTVSAAVTEGVAAALKGNTLSAEDRDALARARKAGEDHKAGLVTKIVANSTMKKEDLEAMPVGTLEIIEAGLVVPAPDFSGRGESGLVINAAADDDPAVAAMTPPSAKELMLNRAKAKSADGANGKVN